jgi:hypothetical protein
MPTAYELIDQHLPDYRPDFIDSHGRYRTQSLFKQYKIESSAAYFTVGKRHEFNPDGSSQYLSLYRLFMDIGDPSEYQFANAVFEDWEQWNRICKNKVLSSQLRIPAWRAELEVKIRSLGITENIQAAREGNVQSAKWLAEKKWSNRTAGRPNKQEVAKEMSIEKAIQSETDDELSRLGIH